MNTPPDVSVSYGGDDQGTTSQIIANGIAGSNHQNQASFRQAALASFETGGSVYDACAAWDNNGNLTISTRTDSGSWTTYTYDGTGGLPTIGPVTADAHNVANLGFDPDGYLHIVYDQHNNALNYRVSSNEITTFDGTLSAETTMLGTNETSVTYPTLFNNPAGTLYFMFRDGVVGNGDLYFYEYDEGATSWGAATGTGANGILIDGKNSSPNESPYWMIAPKFDSDFGSGGFMHLIWVWRDGGGIATNHDLCYVKWDGTNWKQFDGTAQTVVITEENADVIVSIAQGTDLMNQSNFDVDSSGNPHIAYLKDDIHGNMSLFHSYYDGDSWETIQLSYTPVVSGDLFGISRPDIAFDRSTGTAYIFYRDENLSETGLQVLVSTTFTDWIRYRIYGSDVGRWEPTYDRRRWEQDTEIYMPIAEWFTSGASQWPVTLLEWIP